MELPEGFSLAAILQREDPRDAFVSNQYGSLAELPAGAIVGTSSLRRQALISARFPHLIIKPLRGNLDTRLRKLDDGEYAAIILAAAGLKRLGLPERIKAFLEPTESLPAAGQGAMAIEILSARQDLFDALAPLNDLSSSQAVSAERTVSKAFGGSCQIPLAAFAQINDSQMYLRAMVATPDGSQSCQAQVHGKAEDFNELGLQVVASLRAQNADAILAVCRESEHA
jgi:hydroxymethylbilane synthase